MIQNYNGVPDVYTKKERVVSENKDIKVSSTAVYIGACPRGKIGEVIDIFKFNDFIDEFALGLETPFMNNSYLPYAVWVNYLNSNSKLKIIRVVGKNAKKATGKIGEITFNAKDVGKWADDNKLEVNITKKTVDTGEDLFDIAISLRGEEIELLTNLGNDSTKSNYYIPNINSKSDYIEVEITGVSQPLAEGKISLVGGDDDLSTITDEDYLNQLKLLNSVYDYGIIAIPGVSSENVHKGLIAYCDTHNKYPILDAPLGIDTVELLKREKVLEETGDRGAIYYPWIKIKDPSSIFGNLITIPMSGFMTGIIDRIDKKRGVFKAPAGVEAYLEGAIALEKEISVEELGKLNSNKINCAINKRNRGIVMWGVNNISKNSDLKYITDVRLEDEIERMAYEKLDWSIFEPTGLDLCEKIRTSLEGMLEDNFYNSNVKAFKGKNKKEAFFVICDERNNTEKTMDEGYTHVQIGFAKRKPNLFTIINLTIKQQS